MNPATIRSAALAAAGVAALAGLSACEERPYSVPVRQAAYAPPRSTTLAGAPTPAPYAPPPVAYAPPTAYAAPVPAPQYIAPAPTYADPAPPAVAYPPPPPPPVQTYRPAPAYDTGGPMIVAMAPIPNPPEGYHSRHAYAPVGGYGPAPRPHHVVHHYASAAPSYGPALVRPAYVAPPKPAYMAPPKAPSYAAAPAPAPKSYAAATPKAPPVKTTTTTVEKKVVASTQTAAAGAKTAAADAANSAKLAAAKTAEAAKAAAPAAAAKVAQATTSATAKVKETVKTATTPAPSTMPAASGDRTTKLAALQSALTDAVSKNAVLTTPARFTANQPADVSLTLPATFFDTMHKEADKQGLSDAAASANMTSVLAGDGFSVTPDDTQSQPLTAGQPTEFHWTVTAQPGAKGPLHADVGADLLGGGSDTLSLGTVQKSAGGMKMTPKMLGAGILALIVILVLGWLARGRNTPTRSSAARRAGRRARGAGGYNRPLDMNADGDPAR